MIRPYAMAISVALTSGATPGYSKTASYVQDRAQSGWAYYQEPVSRSQLRQSAQESLAALYERCARPGWDGHQSDAVSHAAYSYAYRLMEALPAGLPLPALGAEPDGQITFEWHHASRRTLSVSISPSGDLHYAALLGSSRAYGTEAFFGELPHTILELIGRVYLG